MVKLNSVNYDIEYPIYGAKFLNDKTLLVTGGGGQGNQENSNRLTALTINLTKKKRPIKKFRELKLKEENDAPSCLDSNNNIILLGCNEGQASIKDGHNHNLQKFIYINDHLKYITSTSLENDILPSVYQKFITISKDGSIAAVASSKVPTLIHILDPVNLFEKYEIETNNEVKDLDISPDGKNLTYITKTNTIEIISIITGRSLLRRVDFDKNYNLTKVKFIDDDHVILGISLKDGNGVSLVKLSLSQKLKTVKETIASKKIKSITAIDINLKNGVIAIAGNENSILLFKVQSLKSIKTFSNVHSLSITKITFSPNGQFLASVSAANTVNIIEIPDALGIETHHIYNFFKRSLQLLILAVVIQLAWKYYQSRDVKKLDFSEYFTLTPRSAASQTSTSTTSYYEPKITTPGYVEDEEEEEEEEDEDSNEDSEKEDIVERGEVEEDEGDSGDDEEEEEDIAEEPVTSTTDSQDIQQSSEVSTSKQLSTTETENSSQELVETTETKTETSIVEVTASSTEISTVSETSIVTETSTTESTSLTTETSTVEKPSTTSESSTAFEESTLSSAISEQLSSCTESALSEEPKPSTTSISELNSQSTLSSKKSPASTSSTEAKKLLETDTEILYTQVKEEDIQYESISELPPTSVTLTSTAISSTNTTASSSTKTKKKKKSLRRRKKKSSTSTVPLTSEISVESSFTTLDGFVPTATSALDKLTSQVPETVAKEADKITSKLASKLSKISSTVHASSDEESTLSPSSDNVEVTQTKTESSSTQPLDLEVTALSIESKSSTSQEITTEKESELEKSALSVQTTSETTPQTSSAIKLSSYTKSTIESHDSDASIGVAGTIPLESEASTPFTAESIETPVPKTPEASIEPEKLVKDSVDEDAEPASELEGIIPETPESSATLVETVSEIKSEDVTSQEAEVEETVLDSDSESLSSSEELGDDEYETAEEVESSGDEWDTASEGSIDSENSQSDDEGFETAEEEPEIEGIVIETSSSNEEDEHVINTSIDVPEETVTETLTETETEADALTSDTEEVETDSGYEPDSDSDEELETDSETESEIESDTDDELTTESDAEDELESSIESESATDTEDVYTSDEEDYTTPDDSGSETDEISTPEVEEPLIKEETTTSVDFHDEL